MLARCAFCQQTFETDRFGVQPCPHCGQHVHLADPSAPAPAAPAPQAPPPEPPPPPAAAAPGAPPPPPGWAPPAPGGTWAAVEADAPFVHRRTFGWFATFVATWKLACLRPAEFFRSVRVADARSALLFGVIATTLETWAQAVYGLLIGAVTGTASREWMQEMIKKMPRGAGIDASSWSATWVGGTVEGALLQIVAAPFLAVLSLLAWSAVFHVILVALGAASRGFAGTLTAVSYASGAMLIGALPVPGLAGLVGFVWFAFAAAIGLREVHRTTGGRATAALLVGFLAPCLLCCGCFATGAAALRMLFGGLFGGGGG